MAAQINIGISESDRTAITDGLGKLLADTYTLYLTTHNFHWNVTGPMFNTLHAMFMTQYTELWNAVDPIAERIRSLGFPAPGSYAQFGKLSSIPDAPATPPKAMQMVATLVEGHEAVARTARCTSRPRGCCARSSRTERQPCLCSISGGDAKNLLRLGSLKRW
jgi:starvation-inducible DNA-binding protein